MYNLSDRPKIIINKQEQLKFLVENKPRHKIETLHKMPSIISLQPYGPALKNSQYFLNKDEDNTEEMIPKYRNWQSDTWQDPTRMQEVDFRNQFKKNSWRNSNDVDNWRHDSFISSAYNVQCISQFFRRTQKVEKVATHNIQWTYSHSLTAQ